MTYRIGTSGWSYPHWKGVFYPDALPAARWFQHYCRHFDTVEINATFYRLMPDTTFSGWRDKAPANFLYAVKMWRMITHRRKLHDVADMVTDFLKRAALLGDHLGPILIQLPPHFGLDLDLLKGFLPLLSREFEYAVEFRDPTWFADAVYDLLREHRVAFCIYHHVRIECPKIVTAPLVYLRFHGESGRYTGKYSTQHLKQWADFAYECLRDGRHVVAYFNNDYKGFAVQDARELRELLDARVNRKKRGERSPGHKKSVR